MSSAIGVPVASVGVVFLRMVVRSWIVAASSAWYGRQWTFT